jgi:hypothetical protein
VSFCCLVMTFLEKKFVHIIIILKKGHEETKKGPTRCDIGRVILVIPMFYWLLYCEFYF